MTTVRSAPQRNFQPRPGNQGHGERALRRRQRRRLAREELLAVFVLLIVLAAALVVLGLQWLGSGSSVSTVVPERAVTLIGR